MPRYQDRWRTKPAEFLPNTVLAVRDALNVLETAPEHVRPDRDQVAVVGHSAGGNLAAQLVAVAPLVGLPTPKAAAIFSPGEVLPASGPDLARIPAETALLVASAEEDWFVGDARARRIYQESTAIPAENKTFLMLRSDRRADPPLIADHAAPMAALPRLDSGDGLFRPLQMQFATINRLDTEAIWRATDLTIQAGFNGRPLDEVTLNDARLQFLGHRPDGLPIRPPLVGDGLANIPRVVPTFGIRLVPWPSTLFDPLARPRFRPWPETAISDR